MSSWRISFCAAVAGLSFLSSALANDARFPWTLLTPENDTRDREMQRWDEDDARQHVTLMNESEKLVQGRMEMDICPIRKLLPRGTPFAEFHFDAVHPMEFSPEEKEVLCEWLRRGGFLLLFEDCYPYEQEAFRQHASLPVYDFFTVELPSSDGGFTVDRIDDRHPIFRMIYETTTVPSIARERRENANYRGRTLISYRGRACAFVMGRYSIEQNGRWVPMPRPLPNSHSFDVRSYYLIFNIYAYSMMR